VSKLQNVVNAADDKIFSSFCRKIKVKNIREYEERQLKALQEGAEARTRFNTQINRLRHQLSLPASSLSESGLTYRYRTTFQEDQLKTTKDRLVTLQKTVESEQTALAKLQRTKEATEREIQALQGEIDELNEDLKETQENLEAKTKALDEAKRTANKAGKGLDAVLKEIASMASH
jgi:structural maintenance of chromosome 1